MNRLPLIRKNKWVLSYQTDLQDAKGLASLGGNLGILYSSPRPYTFFDPESGVNPFTAGVHQTAGLIPNFGATGYEARRRGGVFYQEDYRYATSMGWPLKWNRFLGGGFSEYGAPSDTHLDTTEACLDMLLEHYENNYALPSNCLVRAFVSWDKYVLTNNREPYALGSAQIVSVSDGLAVLCRYAVFLPNF